jgi:glutaredoxin 2
MSKQPRRLNLKSNRKKSAFYYKQVLDSLEKLDLQLTSDTAGLDSEITLVRLKIMSMLRYDADFKTVAQAINILARLVVIRDSLSQKSGVSVKDAIVNVLKDIAVPLGVVTLSKKL